MIRKILSETWFISPYAVILSLICLIDLTVTALGIYFDLFLEENPILSYFLTLYGLAGLIIVKMFFAAVPISILEVTPKINLISKQKVIFYYWILIPLYVLILIFGIVYKWINPI